MSDWWTQVTNNVADRAGQQGDAALTDAAGSPSLFAPGPKSTVTATQAVTPPPLLGGIPEGYGTQLLPGGGGIATPPTSTARYRVGDAETIFGPKSPEDLWAIQEQLKAAGLLPTSGSSFTPGYFDKTTANAAEELLGISNLHNQVWQTTLNELVVAQAAHPTTKAVRAPLRLSLSNPDDVRWTADQVAKSILGRRLHQSEADKIVATVGANETAAQQAQYAGTNPDNPQAGTDVNPPSVEATVMNSYMGNAEQTQYAMTNTFLDFADLLKSPV